jgi:hypothetical protein
MPPGAGRHPVPLLLRPFRRFGGRRVLPLFPPDRVFLPVTLPAVPQGRQIKIPQFRRGFGIFPVLAPQLFGGKPEITVRPRKPGRIGRSGKLPGKAVRNNKPRGFRFGFDFFYKIR